MTGMQIALVEALKVVGTGAAIGFAIIGFIYLF